MKLCKHTPFDRLSLLGRSFTILGVGEVVLDVAVCIKGHRLTQALIVFVNLTLVSKVKGG